MIILWFYRRENEHVLLVAMAATDHSINNWMLWYNGIGIRMEKSYVLSIFEVL
jgi:hypothetical protein